MNTTMEKCFISAVCGYHASRYIRKPLLGEKRVAEWGFDVIPWTNLAINCDIKRDGLKVNKLHPQF